MAKILSNILKGVNKSTVAPLTTGDIPGVDYADKMKDSRDFVAQHSLEKHEDRVGNGDDVYAAAKVKKAKMERHGHEPKPKDVKVYQQANEAAGGTEDPTTNARKKIMDHAMAVLQHKSTMAAQKKKVNEAKDEGEYGYEGDMAMSQLKSIMRNANQLLSMLKPETDLPEWVQSKITLSEDYITTATNYMTSEMSEAKMCETCGKADCSCGMDGDKQPKYGSKKGKKLLLDKKKLEEKLTPSTPVGEVIKDFVHSDNPKFAGKSKAERQKMALGAWYSMHPKKSKKMENESAPADTSIATPSTLVGDTGRV